MADKQRDSAAPTGRLPTVVATGPIPETLAGHEPFRQVAPFKHQVVERDRLGSVSADPLGPHRPAWLAQRGKPAKLKLPGLPRRRLVHRGLERIPYFIFGADDRWIYNDTTYPWGCVCRLVLSGGFGGSGVIIGPRHVLTASHVIDWANGLSGVVEVNRRSAEFSAASRIEAAWYYARLTGEGDSTTDDDDYAVLVMEDRIGDWFGYFGARTYDSGWDDEPYWMNIGYAGDIGMGNNPLFHSQLKLDEAELDFGGGRALSTKADISPGQSGSPMFGVWDDGFPYVVAVVSSGGDDWFYGRENWCSAGSNLTRLVRHARSESP